MKKLDLIIDLHVRNERQGPGSDAQTERAVDIARLDPTLPLAIADIGCGTGASSRALARTLNARITAIDAAAPFIRRMKELVKAQGLDDRIEPIVERMESLPFGDSQFDVIWSEGAIYNMGFEAGLRAWRRLLRPGGVIAVSEITWTTAARPAELEAHWTREYPGIATGSEKLRLVEQEGYEPLGVFFLPPDCWEEHYYRPLEASFRPFLRRHQGSVLATEVVRAEQAEIALHRRFGAWCGYAFYVARKSDASASYPSGTACEQRPGDA